MLFKQQHLAGIKTGDITLAFRKWKKPTVKRGSLLKTAIGQIEIGAIEEVDIASISALDAQKAGFTTLDQLLRLLQKVNEGSIYKIELAYHSPDPRVELRSKEELTNEEFHQLKKKLERLDKYSKTGAWTREVLESIRQNPKLKAADLAVLLSKEKDWLKINIRKLKNLGLTISHNPGYEISPLGKAFLEMF